MSSPRKTTTDTLLDTNDNAQDDDPNNPSWMISSTTATTTTVSDARKRIDTATGDGDEHDFLVRAEDDNDDTTAASQILMGCGDKTLLCHLRFINLLDLSLGLILIVYGSLIHFGSAKALSRLCLIFGCSLMLSVLLSELSLRHSTCQRCGLWIGSYLAVGLGIMYFILGFYILLAQTPITNYLSEHQHDLYMNPTSIHNLVVKAGPWLCMIGMIMSIMEGTRFFIMKHVRQKLLLPSVTRNLMGNGELSRPLLLGGSEAAYSQTNDEDDFFPIDESSLHSDPLWWAKSNSNNHISNNDGEEHRLHQRNDNDRLHHEPNWVV